MPIERISAVLCSAVLVSLATGLPAEVSAQDAGDTQVVTEGDAAKTEGEHGPVAAAAGEGEGAAPDESLESEDALASGQAESQSFLQRDTLTDEYFGLGPKLGEIGIESTFNVWMLYQGVVDGGLRSEDGTSGFYFFENHFDLEKLFGLTGATVLARVDGSWDDSINDSVGALMSANTLTYGDNAIGLTHLMLELTFLEERIRFRIGKEDTSQQSFDFHGRGVSFDSMPYANFQGTQFLDAGLVNNASIPFPQSGPSAVLLVEPIERVYVAAAGVSRNADNFTFIGSDDFNTWMLLTEVGFVAEPGGMPGQYYVGYWYSEFDDAPHANGIYFGVAQSVYQESGSTEQGLGIFARYGYATEQDIEHFWSFGGQYDGLLPGRDGDTLSIGWAQSFTRGAGFDEQYEGALESYYRARLTPWLYISPHVQYIVNPGSSDVDDALTLGIRAQITF